MDIDAYRGLEPVQLWRHFAALNAIPRPSGHEAEAREYVLQIAEAGGADSHVDARGNALVRLPPTAGGAGPTVAVQAHLDMVCETESGVRHDWKRDPVVPRREGDRIFASGTTLGADNGIGVAACLSLITAPDVPHGELELIFTVDEESGRWGAFDLDASSLKASALINLDSEDAGALTIGSAGGCNVDVALPLPGETPPAGAHGLELVVDGLQGGHSGIQIHERRANAIKLLAEALERLRSAGLDVRPASVDGGSAHNAIPRTARAKLTVAAGDLAGARQAIADMRESLHESWGSAEPGLTLELEEDASRPALVLGEDATARLLTLLHSLPHGVLEESERFPGTVETSMNLAAIRTEDEEAKILTSVRSISASALEKVQSRIRDLADASGASAEVKGGYPSWEPRQASPLVDAAVAAYRRTYGREPRLDVLHGGLECGAIVANKLDLDAVSFGPLIRGAHTPTEHVYASTVAGTWRLLATLLADLSRRS